MTQPPKHLLKLAKRAQHRWAFHAVLVKRGGAVVSQGYNHGETHAEVMALGKLWPNKRVGTTIWSIRVTRTGKLAMAKPCLECMEYLKENKIKNVIYSTDCGTLEKMKL